MAHTSYNPEKIIQYLEDVLGKKYNAIIFVHRFEHVYNVYIGKKVLASFKIKPFPGNCGIAIIYNLMVAMDYRKQGVGNIVAKAAVDIADEAGYSSVQITCLKTNAAAVAIADKLSFQLQDQFRNSRTDNAVVVLSRPISIPKIPEGITENVQSENQ